MASFRIPALLLMLGLSGTATATMASAGQNPDVVARNVRQFLVRQARAWPGTAQITVDRPDTGRLASCDRLQVFLRGRQQMESRMSVGVRCLTPELWTTYVQASVTIQGTYYVAGQSIAADATVAPDDLVPRQGDLLRLPAGTVTDPRDIVGRVATHRIAAGRPIRARALRSPESIQRGQFVRTVAQGAVFVSSGSGKALQGGPPGTQIQVRTSSGRIISATVVDANTVRVAM
jgi:flagella basal body P-ring formation protein FlgA